ncbi:hypothetical protein LVV93_25495, partial [Klebsiella pneumoniae]|nr:hypothetical protein [Klebsiella pneumoniae]
KACVLPENPASYRVVRTKSYLFNKAAGQVRFRFSLSGTWLTICNIIIKYNYASYFYSQNANNVAYTPV